MPRPFYIGLNMAGAISAGAYTAGVFDFLIDALDTWYAARAMQQQQFGDDYDRWEIPAHDVRLVVMSGASAGGMTAALAAAALCEPFQSVREVPPGAAPAANRLYQSWVADVDARDLLGGRDLDSPSATVRSLLDSTKIDELAANALRIDNPVPCRPWVSPRLRIILTLTNLRGVPYAIESGSGADETQTLHRADSQEFELLQDGAAPTNRAIPLSPTDPSNWWRLAQCAKATGAFPIMLAPRILTRTASEYNYRLWRIRNPHPKDAGGECRCEILSELSPHWEAPDSAVFQTVNVDGGLTNNSPFELANRVLGLQDPQIPPGSEPEAAADVDRAVISIAPFLTTPQFDIQAPPDTNLLHMFGQLIDALVNQSRIQGESIMFTQDTTVFNRFVVAPSIDSTTVDALASATLGAFGGFVAREFRDHDYQLGRRNCQWFLKRYFGLPPENRIMREYAPGSDAARNRLLKRFGITLENGQRGLPLIPLLSSALKAEVKPQRPAIARSRIEPIADAALDRVHRVVSHLLEQHRAGWLPGSAFQAGWFMARRRLKTELLKKIGYELGRQALVD